MTISELAKKLNLSKSTVSYAINGGPKPVSAEVRDRVMKAVKEYGYRPNPVARSLATKDCRTIGFVPNELQPAVMYSGYAALALQALYAYAHEKQMHVLLPSGYDPMRADETRDLLFSAPVSGFILVLPENLKALKDIISRGVPMMAIAGKSDGLIPTVNADNRGGIRQALRHLFQLGHRKIGMIGSRNFTDTAARFDEFKDFMGKLSLDVKRDWIFECMPTFDAGYETSAKFFALKDRPTAVVCVNDLVAAATLRRAYEFGVSVPGQLSIVGFDNDSDSRNSIIPITTIRQPIQEMAVAALEGILAQLDGEFVKDIVLPTELIARETTARPN